MVITNNKTVLILGCSSDIGVQTARIFLEKKWKVIGHYNKSKKKMVYLQKKYGNNSRNQQQNFFSCFRRKYFNTWTNYQYFGRRIILLIKYINEESIAI